MTLIFVQSPFDKAWDSIEYIEFLPKDKKPKYVFDSPSTPEHKKILQEAKNHSVTAITAYER